MTDSLDYPQHEEREQLAKLIAERINPYWFNGNPAFEPVTYSATDAAFEWHTRQLQELRDAVKQYHEGPDFAENVDVYNAGIRAAAGRLVDTTEDL